MQCTYLTHAFSRWSRRTTSLYMLRFRPFFYLYARRLYACILQTGNFFKLLRQVGISIWSILSPEMASSDSLHDTPSHESVFSIIPSCRYLLNLYKRIRKRNYFMFSLKAYLQTVKTSIFYFDQSVIAPHRSLIPVLSRYQLFPATSAP